MMDAISDLIRRNPELEPCARSIAAAHELLVSSYQQGGKLLVCGNGGSAADSEHIVAELMKGFHSARPLAAHERQALEQNCPGAGEYLADRLQGALPAVSLVSQTALISAFANDVSADLVFAQQVYGYGRPGDTLLGISTSGSSQNVLYALHTARARSLHTLGLLGPQGGQAAELCDVAICVPGSGTVEIQERHIAIYHALCALLEETFFGVSEAVQRSHQS